jgi:hypothetical protein
MKYASDLVGAACSIRIGIIVTPSPTARSTSRRTWRDSFVFDEKISTITRALLMASMMASPHSAPGEMSRGAIQQRMPAASSVAQAASAADLSICE